MKLTVGCQTGHYTSREGTKRTGINHHHCKHRCESVLEGVWIDPWFSLEFRDEEMGAYDEEYYLGGAPVLNPEYFDLITSQSRSGEWMMSDLHS